MRFISKYSLKYRPSALEGIEIIKKYGSDFDFQELIKHLDNLHHVSFGLPLEDMADLDLKNCFKIYFGEENQFRIVYEIKNDVVSIISILAIGFREGYQVYQDAALER